MSAFASNPNASVAGLTGAVTSIVLWAAGLAGVEMPMEVGAAIATVAVGAVLAIGKRAPAG